MVGTPPHDLHSSFTIGGPITADRSVLTITSMRGKVVADHTSMFLEHYAEGGPETRFIHLTAQGPQVIIEDFKCQYPVGPTLLKMGTSLPLEKPEKVAGVPQRSFELDNEQKGRFQLALEKFKTKHADGRYRYAKPGGVLGAMFSLPGTRGVNCADFVIKVLGDAGISVISKRLVDLPSRLTR
jgi:hypothetical protein